jgi:colanic acid biosynthesis protein WcaH
MRGIVSFLPCTKRTEAARQFTPIPKDKLMPEKLKIDDFLQVIKLTPLVAIDLIIKNNNSEYLLGLRNNKPAQGFWFVPGGRIYKGECESNLDPALARIIREEINGSYSDLLKAKHIHFRNVYFHKYDDNFINAAEITTEYVVLAYDICLDIPLNELPKSQHDLYRWFSVDEICSNGKYGDGSVHNNTKAYFMHRPASIDQAPSVGRKQ